MARYDDGQSRPWYESDGAPPSPRPPRQRHASPAPTTWDGQNGSPSWVSPTTGAVPAPYRFDLEPSRPRYLAGRLVVRLGAGGWIVTFILAAAFSSLVDSSLSTGLWALFFVLGLMASVVMTFAGILMSVAMLVAITMDLGVRLRRQVHAAMDRADDERRSPTINLDRDPRERDYR